MTIETTLDVQQAFSLNIELPKEDLNPVLGSMPAACPTNIAHICA